MLIASVGPGDVLIIEFVLSVESRTSGTSLMEMPVSVAAIQNKIRKNCLRNNTSHCVDSSSESSHIRSRVLCPTLPVVSVLCVNKPDRIPPPAVPESGQPQ